ncbi:MAG: hypothetical protein A2887_02900 [Alphaproteobacteria bacterium RIFCSPLOWO2_01_FULL_40_26]|nr:MAG: hypothetical protein A3D15_02635 [Alphaproteobacteria bacterium RIFCSPHIGHO2_02_FULL_40_34]OFW86349.1 MAG: hypothetical protein A2794_03215 [Alphaproteobacteria bacterium RIFCSPHIGHO2_01_FULL_40_8]OFW95111.1 MAG: hypothetical protein A2887_02900 [Alphaproteobacteria bacterium RIFCSPLOWO2_01_FULL_40_26]OFX09066.1 MAG: hypothetical protein A3H30_03450 [Alphaproteobacteria bacterium RIFCSPLOWO2_02_FULL_40_19]OFX10713.1 MAG: hypothetical protein A3G22_03330 [Alphaproteobacteria bacterium RI
MNFWQNFAAIFFLLISSCSSFDNSNEAFEKKYRKEVAKITKERAPKDQQKKPIVFTSTPPSEAELMEDIVGEGEYYPYADIAKLGDKPRYENLPNGEIYQQMKSQNPANNLPPNIFEITYNTVLHPPFQMIGAEFDVIQIPDHDAYGVATAMSDKNYLLVSGEALQRSVDKINSEKTAIDAEINNILVAEKKRLARKRKAEKIFGENLQNSSN